MDAIKTQAMEAVLRGLQALKQAKKRGLDVKPYRSRVKEADRLFRSGDYRGVMDRMERIIVEVAGPPQPEG